MGDLEEGGVGDSYYRYDEGPVEVVVAHFAAVLATRAQPWQEAPWSQRPSMPSPPGTCWAQRELLYQDLPL